MLRLGFVTTPLPRLSSPLSPVSALLSCFPATSCVLSVGLRQISGTCCLILQKYCTVGFLPVVFSNAGLEAGIVACGNGLVCLVPSTIKKTKIHPKQPKPAEPVLINRILFPLCPPCEFSQCEVKKLLLCRKLGQRP